MTTFSTTFSAKYVRELALVIEERDREKAFRDVEKAVMDAVVMLNHTSVFIRQEKYVEDVINALPARGFTVKRDERRSNGGPNITGWTISW